VEPKEAVVNEDEHDDPPPVPMWNQKKPVVNEDEHDDPPPVPMWNQKKPVVNEDEHDGPPPVPMWNQKKPVVNEDEHDGPPQVPMWNQKKAPATDVDDCGPPPAPLWNRKPKEAPADASQDALKTASIDSLNSQGGGASSDPAVAAAPAKRGKKGSRHGSLYHRAEAVAAQIRRRPAKSVHVAANEGEVVTILETHDHKYELGKELGAGAYATVRMCQSSETHAAYAVKIFQRSFLKKRRFSAGQWTTNLDGVHREIAIMKKLSHANVMTLYDCCMSQNNLYMVMEFCTLGAIMETEKLPCAPLDMRDTRRWFADSVLGLQYLHFQSVVHHDIKPDNILVNSKRAAVISDFGVSRAYGGTSEKGASGTPLYNSPEKIMSTKGYDGKAADVWALGVTLYAMVFGDLPYPAAGFESADALEAAITADEEWQCAKPCDDAPLLILLKGMLQKKSVARYTLDQVAESEWDKADIERENTAQGSPRASWKPIVLDKGELRHAVDKGKLKQSKSRMNDDHPLGQTLDTVAENEALKSVSGAASAERRVSVVQTIAGGCFGRRKPRAADDERF